VHLDWASRWDCRLSQLQNKDQYMIEVPVSRIMGHKLRIPGKTEVDIVKDYFACNHRYRTGQLRVADRATMLAAEGAQCFQGMDFGAVFTEDVRRAEATRQDFFSALADPAGSEVMYIAAHGWQGGHVWADGLATIDDVLGLPKTAVCYLVNSCGALEWYASAFDPTNPHCMGQLYVFDKSSGSGGNGLLSIGPTFEGGLPCLWYFSQYLQANPSATYGDAFRFWFQRKLMQDEFRALDETLLGDPTIGPRTHHLWVRGDVNGDGAVDDKDLAAFIEAWRSKRAGTTDWNLRADVDLDGDLDAEDANQLIPCILQAAKPAPKR
jgi:hypothetical protein